MPIQHASIKTNLFGDRRVLRLYQLLPESDVMAAMGYWLYAVLDSWGDEEPKRIHAPDALIAALQEVGLADAEGLIPAEQLQKAMSKLTRQRERQREKTARWRERQRVTDGDGHSQVPSTVQYSTVPSGIGESEGEGALPALQWLAEHVGYVDTYDGIGLMLSSKVRDLGIDEVMRRLAVLHDRGHLDRGDTFGYVTGITDGFRRNRPPTPAEEEHAEIEAAKAKRRKRMEAE